MDIKAITREAQEGQGCQVMKHIEQSKLNPMKLFVNFGKVVGQDQSTPGERDARGLPKAYLQGYIDFDAQGDKAKVSLVDQPSSDPARDVPLVTFTIDEKTNKVLEQTCNNYEKLPERQL